MGVGVVFNKWYGINVEFPAFVPFCHFLLFSYLFILCFLNTRTTILLPPSLHRLFNKRALVVIAQSGTSLFIQMSNNAAAPPTHIKYTYTHTQDGGSVCTCRSISLISLPPLPLPPYSIFHIQWVVDLAARYRYVSIKCRQGSVLTCSVRGLAE